MNKVYICSPLRGDIQANIQKARKYCEYTMTQCGAIPIAPHIYFTQFLDDAIPAERSLGLNAGLELLHDCDELWVFGDRITEGMAQEIYRAEREEIPVRQIDNEKLALDLPIEIQMGGM